MKSDKSDENALIVVDSEDVPQELAILLVENQVAFPGLNMTLAVSTKSMALVDAQMKKNRLVGVVGITPSSGSLPHPEQVQEAGTVIRILYVTQTTENQATLVVHGLRRFRIKRWLENRPYLRAEVAAAPEVVEADIETEAMFRTLRNLTIEVFTMSLSAPKEAIEGLTRIKSPLALGYIAAAHADIDSETRQQILDEDSLQGKLRMLISHFSHEKEVLSLGKKIQREAQDEMSKSQRDYYLRQQLEAIKKELGESDGERSEPEAYRQRVQDADMSAEARQEAMRELDRLAEMSPQSAEYPMIKAYLDWLLGGRAAEEIVFDDISTGAHKDLSRATDIARSMVKEYGMSRNLGQVYMAHNKQGQFLNQNPDSGGDYSAMTAHLIDKEIRQIIDDEYDRALDILRSKRDILEQTAAKLLESEVIDGEELEALAAAVSRHDSPNADPDAVEAQPLAA